MVTNDLEFITLHFKTKQNSFFTFNTITIDSLSSETKLKILKLIDEEYKTIKNTEGEIVALEKREINNEN